MEIKQENQSVTQETRQHRWPARFLLLVFRTGLFLVMTVFLSAGVLWLGINKLFNAQQISQAVTYQLQKVFDRPVVISSVDLKFLNTVELAGFAVLDNQVQPGMPVA